MTEAETKPARRSIGATRNPALVRLATVRRAPPPDRTTKQYLPLLLAR